MLVVGETALLKFIGVADDAVVYNPSPVLCGGNMYLAANIEERIGPVTFIFKKEGKSSWKLIKDSLLPISDPFFVKTSRGLILGGVEDIPGEIGSSYRTVFYKQKKEDDFSSFVKISGGIAGMRDIGLVELPDGNMAVFTRHIGGKFGYGLLGYVEYENFYSISNDALREALPLDIDKEKDEWFGVSQAKVLPDSFLGVLGYRASGDGYEVIVFIYDFVNCRTSPYRVIVSPEDFPGVKPRRFPNVIIPGGWIDNEDGTMDVYVGIGDSCAGVKKIQNPLPRLSRWFYTKNR